MRKVFLDDLPKQGKRIQWDMCKGIKVRFIYDDIDGEIEIKSYDKKDHSLLVSYKNNDDYKIYTSSFRECMLGNLIGKYRLEHMYGIGDIVQENSYPFEIIEQTRIKDKHKIIGSRGYTVKCMTCGSIHENVREDKLGNYGRIYKCRTCNDGLTYPEKLMSNVLKQLNLKFYTQQKFDWSKNKVYDFYIPSPYNIIIETHGEQHYKDKSGWDIKYEHQVQNDNLKKNLALSNSIKCYVQIDCRKSELEFIKENILNSELNELFDLNNIDWLECNNNATSSWAKLACDLWNSGVRNTPTIANIIGMTKQSVITYLKRFTKLGLCDYDPKEEQRKGNQTTAIKKKKPIICLDTGIVFDSAVDCERNSVEVFGIKLSQDKISAVARGERTHHKGYHFMFYKDYLAQQQSA